MLKVSVISLWRFMTTTFNWWSRWSDIIRSRGEREFWVGSEVIVAAGAAHCEEYRQLESLETVILL